MSESSTLTADYASGAYYTNAVAWADNLGLLGGTGVTFKPGDACPRSDVVTYLYRNASDGASDRSKVYTPDYDKWDGSFLGNGTSKTSTVASSNGQRLLRIKSPVPNHAMITQVVPVKPHTDYVFTAILRMDDYQPGEENSGGACIGIANPELNVVSRASEYVTRGDIWTSVSAVFNAGNASSVRLCLSNGWYDAASAGTAHFTGITLEERGTNEAPPIF